MHLAINDVCLAEGSVLDKLRLMRQAGLRAAEVHYGSAVQADAGNFRKAAAAFDVVTFHAPPAGPAHFAGDAPARERLLQDFGRMLGDAADLGARFVVFHAGNLRYGAAAEAFEPMFGAFLRGVDERACASGVWACWETNADYAGHLGRLECIRTLGLRRTGLCLDVAHLVAIRRWIDCEDNPQTFGAFVDRFGSLVRCGHIHDWIDDDPPHHGRHDHHVIGQGCIDYGEVFAELGRCGFDGPLCLEYHPAAIPSLEALWASCGHVVALAAAAGVELIVDGPLKPRGATS